MFLEVGFSAETWGGRGGMIDHLMSLDLGFAGYKKRLGEVYGCSIPRLYNWVMYRAEKTR